MTPALYQDISHVAVLIRGPPQIVTLTMNSEKDLVQMPLVTRLRTPASKLIRIRLSKLLAPLADGFVRDQHTTDKQQLFDIAIAEAEAVIQPDPMVNDFGGKTMVFVALRGRWRGMLCYLDVCCMVTHLPCFTAVSMPDWSRVGSQTS
jgi:hypothetical protein